MSALQRFAVMVRPSPQHDVKGGIRSRHDSAMDAEVEAARLRSLGWHAYARDFEQERTARGAEREARRAAA
jgi:hypothetical protein